MMDTFTFALIHSPLVGPFTWQLVGQELAKRHFDVIVPMLIDRPESTRPFWEQHVESVAASLARLTKKQDIVLVAHSGAGPLLPAIRYRLTHPIRAYVFVDAGLPRSGLSRLELMGLEDQSWAAEFHQSLLQGGIFPAWTEEDLRDILPAEDMRRQLVAELHPRSLPFFIEPLPVFDDWPDAPCAYIQLSTPYAWDAAQARQTGWPTRIVDVGHFHLLVDPAAVADWIVDVL